MPRPRGTVAMMARASSWVKGRRDKYDPRSSGKPRSGAIRVHGSRAVDAVVASPLSVSGASLDPDVSLGSALLKTGSAKTATFLVGFGRPPASRRNIAKTEADG